MLNLLKTPRHKLVSSFDERDICRTTFLVNNPLLCVHKKAKYLQ